MKHKSAQHAVRSPSMHCNVEIGPGPFLVTSSNCSFLTA